MRPVGVTLWATVRHNRIFSRMDDYRRVYRIFLASPGDLDRERGRIRALVEELNKVIAPKLELIVELYGWEDQAPAPGRPQEIINQHLDRSHLFVGLLAERWGSETGEAPSGFFEEYTRARARRDKEGSPDIVSGGVRLHRVGG